MFTVFFYVHKTLHGNFDIVYIFSPNFIVPFFFFFFIHVCLSSHWNLMYFWHDNFPYFMLYMFRCTSLNVIRDPYSTNRPGLVSIIPDVSPTPVRPPLAPLSQLQENAFPGEHCILQQQQKYDEI